MLTVSDIRRLLPHGHPALLVDCVLALEPGRSIVATKAITQTEPCYQAVARGAPLHAYGYPVSLLLESFGQTAALLWLSDAAPEGLDADRVLMLVGARDCRIEGRAFPGDVLRHEAGIDHVVGDNVFVSGSTHVSDRRVATIGSMIAVLRPRSQHEEEIHE